MTPRTITAQSVTGMALKVVGALLASYLVHDAMLDREHEQSMTAALDREVDDKQRLAASHDGYAVRLQEERAILSRMEQRLPSKFDAPAIEKTLHDQATLSGVQIASVQLGKEHLAEGFYADLPMDLVVKGPTVEFVKFMDGLLRDSPLRLVTAMKIEPTDNATTLRAAMTVHYYRSIGEDE